MITFFAGVDYERAVERARGSPSRYASLAMAGAVVNAFSRGEFHRGREISREAVQGARMSPHPGAVLAMTFNHVDPESLETELASALHMLDEVDAGLWDQACVHGIAGVLAALFGKVAIARQEMEVALEMSRRIGNPTQLGIALYGSALASWQSDPTAAETALEEHIQIANKTGRTYILGRVLALRAQLLTHGGDRPAAVESLRDGLVSSHIDGDLPGTAVCLTRGAVVMAALGEHESAAVFLGAATNAALPRQSGVSPNEIPDYNSFKTTLRSQLGDDRYTAATDRGAAMTYEQAAAFALAVIEGLSRS
jgi:hypothetical protein